MCPVVNGLPSKAKVSNVPSLYQIISVPTASKFRAIPSQEIVSVPTGVSGIELIDNVTSCGWLSQPLTVCVTQKVESPKVVSPVANAVSVFTTLVSSISEYHFISVPAASRSGIGNPSQPIVS